MRKPDDDLKIDISELFGGEMPTPSEKLEESGAEETLQPGAGVGTASAESENKFQEWMNSRNVELEAKSLELEKKIQQNPPPSPEAVQDHFSGEELLAAQSPVEAPPAPSSSAVDFSAPMAPPFMGPAVAAPAQEASEATAASGAEGQAAEVSAEQLKKIQAEYEFLMLYDEFRNIIVYELKDLVGERKSLTMLGRTVELAREKYPDIFRNANWDSTGNLLEDGSVDSQRIIDNKNTLDPQKADAVLDGALSTLLKLRLQAVEKGLGTGLKNKVRAHLYQWISEKVQKASREGKDATNLKRLSSYVAST